MGYYLHATTYTRERKLRINRTRDNEEVTHPKGLAATMNADAMCAVRLLTRMKIRHPVTVLQRATIKDPLVKLGSAAAWAIGYCRFEDEGVCGGGGGLHNDNVS